MIYVWQLALLAIGFIIAVGGPFYMLKKKKKNQSKTEPTSKS